LFADEEVHEEYQSALARGLSEEEAMREAETDTTCAGSEGHYILSWEWQVTENPTRAFIQSLVEEHIVEVVQ